MNEKMNEKEMKIIDFGSTEYHKDILGHKVRVMGIQENDARRIWYECECGMTWESLID